MLTREQLEVLEAIPSEEEALRVGIGEEVLRERFPDSMHLLRQLYAEGYVAEPSLGIDDTTGDRFPIERERVYVRTPEGDAALLAD